MIVEIHAGRLSSAAMPPEHQPPLLVHPDRMPVGESSLQLSRDLGGFRNEWIFYAFENVLISNCL
jgi:hypothetical protein